MKLINFNDRLGHTDLVLEGKKTMKREYITYPEYFSNTLVCGFNIRSKEGETPKLIMHDGDYLDIKGAYIKPKYEIGEIIAVSQTYRDVDDFYAAAAFYKHSEDKEKVVPEFERLSLEDLANWENKSFSLSKEKGWKNKKYVKADLMPHHIRITGIRVEPIQAISKEDCLREGIIETTCFDVNNISHNYYWYRGVTKHNVPYGQYKEYKTPQIAFEAMYKEMYGERPFDSNFHVFVYMFELI